jgi:hypothetical protein
MGKKTILLLAFDEKGEKVYKYLNLPERPFADERIVDGELCITVSNVIHALDLPCNLVVRVECFSYPDYRQCKWDTFEKNGWAKCPDNSLKAHKWI